MRSHRLTLILLATAPAWAQDVAGRVLEDSTGDPLVATDEQVDSTPESIGRVRNRFQEVDVSPSGSAQVQLEPGKIE